MYVKLLEITIDSSLKWANQIEGDCKISFKPGVFNKETQDVSGECNIGERLQWLIEFLNSRRKLYA